MSNDVLRAWREEVCAELLEMPIADVRKLRTVTMTMAHLKDPIKIGEILSARDLFAEFLLAAPSPAPNEVTSE